MKEKKYWIEYIYQKNKKRIQKQKQKKWKKKMIYLKIKQKNIRSYIMI